MTYQNEAGGPTALPEILGYSLTGDSLNAQRGPAPLDPAQFGPVQFEHAVRLPEVMTPDRYIEVVEKHMLGCADYSVDELVDIGKHAVSIYRRGLRRLDTKETS